MSSSPSTDPTSSKLISSSSTKQLATPELLRKPIITPIDSAVRQASLGERCVSSSSTCSTIDSAAPLSLTSQPPTSTPISSSTSSHSSPHDPQHAFDHQNLDQSHPQDPLANSIISFLALPEAGDHEQQLQRQHQQ